MPLQVGLVIGAGGKTIRGIQKETGAGISQVTTSTHPREISANQLPMTSALLVYNQTTVYAKCLYIPDARHICACYIAVTNMPFCS
jgi:hypothetical protein